MSVSRVFLHKLTVAQPLKNFGAFYAKQRSLPSSHQPNSESNQASLRPPIPFLQGQFTAIHPSTPRSSSAISSLRFPLQTPLSLCMSLRLHSFYMIRPFYPPWPIRPSNIRWKLHSTKQLLPGFLQSPVNFFLSALNTFPAPCSPTAPSPVPPLVWLTQSDSNINQTKSQFLGLRYWYSYTRNAQTK